jgi:hypothetical protein
MAVTENLYTGDGSTVLYSFTFPYLATTDVKVSLNGSDTTAYSLANATQVQLNTAPASGVAIRVYRDTSDDSLSASFFPGAAIKSTDLNNNFTQNLYVTQESNDLAEKATTTANTAKTTADSATTAANTAVSTANAASTAAASAVTTANTASTNATNAVTTANTASTNATSAVNTANTASTNATTAVNTANAATTTANTALTNSRESDGLGGFNTAISIANAASSTATTASTTASSAVTTANTASTTANTANTNATAAVNTANAASAAVSNAVLFTLVANVAAIPGSPSNNDYVEIGNSTGIESFSPLSGLPSGFVGSTGLTVRLRYATSGSSWVFMSYFANDSETRYLTTSLPVVIGDSTNGSGQITLNCENNSHGIKIKGPPHSAAANYTLTLPNTTGTNGQFLSTNGSGALSWGTADVSSRLALAGGTMTGFITLHANPTANLHAATKQYVDSNAILVADGGNFDSGASLVTSSSTFDGGSF